LRPESSLHKFHKYLKEILASFQEKSHFLSPEQKEAFRDVLKKILAQLEIE